MPRYDNARLIELARHLLRDDTSLIDEIRLAIDRPRDYVARFRQRLSGRGIREPYPELPWIALVDGLIERGRLQEVDWAGPPHDVQSAMRALTAQKEEWAWLVEPEWCDDYPKPYELFPRIQDRLSKNGLALVVVNIGADCYPLIVLPVDRVEEARRLAELAGYGEIIPADEAR